jgi:MYXO-CTERM domain-containing protein
VRDSESPVKANSYKSKIPFSICKTPSGPFRNRHDEGERRDTGERSSGARVGRFAAPAGHGSSGSTRSFVVASSRTRRSTAGLGSLIVNAVEQLATLGTLDVSTKTLGKLQGLKGETSRGSTTSSLPCRWTSSLTPTSTIPAYANGLDDDSDGLIDDPSDPGCSSAHDDQEDDAPSDASVDASDSGAGGSDGGAGDATVSNGTPPDLGGTRQRSADSGGEEGGCGCRSAGRDHGDSPASGLLVLVAAALLGLRRRPD